MSHHSVRGRIPDSVILAVLSVGILFGCGRESATRSGDAPPPGPARRPEPLPPELQEVVGAIGQQRLETARDLAERYLARHPGDGRAAFFIGLTHYQTDNFGKAKPYFEQTLELSPDYFVVHQYFGRCLYMLGDMVGARREYERHIAADPELPDAHYGLGLVALEERRVEDGESAFRNAIDRYEQRRQRNPQKFRGSEPGLARCHARLADVYFAKEEYESARDHLLLSTQIAPRNISAFYTLSLVYRRLGEEELADRALLHYESSRDAVIRARERDGG